MIRRRRRGSREIAFNFDSFLDLVANVIGIILRLILVAWVGARSYRAIVPPPLPPPAALTEPVALPEPTDPRLEQLAARRAALARESAVAAAEQEARQRELQAQASTLAKEMELLARKDQGLGLTAEMIREEARRKAAGTSAVETTVSALQKRSRDLMASLESLRRLPSKRKELRYHTPVSSPLQTEEVMFECHNGRVTLIDTAALLQYIRRDTRSKADALRDRWEISDSTPAVGAFRLRYVVERERGLLDGLSVGKPSDGTFRYGLASWEVVPVAADRGEPADRALATGSAFRRITDALEPQQTAVTLWVYPDSFALYRKLRDYLHARDVVVAGRPLPEGVPIASSRRGTASRGQ